MGKIQTSWWTLLAFIVITAWIRNNLECEVFCFTFLPSCFLLLSKNNRNNINGLKWSFYEFLCLQGVWQQDHKEVKSVWTWWGRGRRGSNYSIFPTFVSCEWTLREPLIRLAEEISPALLRRYWNLCRSIWTHSETAYCKLYISTHRAHLNKLHMFEKKLFNPESFLYFF